jgi:hypothetical protein
MSAQTTSPAADEAVAGLVVLTLYAAADLAVCARISQVLSIRRFVVERLVADLSRFDHGKVRGLEGVPGPVMRISLAVSAEPADVVRLRKLLNRVVDVYRVEDTFRM